MVNVRQLVFTLPWIRISPDALYHEPAQSAFELEQHDDSWHGIRGSESSKSIGIVGAGSAGLSAIETFLRVARSTEQNWDIVAFEQRRDVGGVWYVMDWRIS